MTVLCMCAAMKVLDGDDVRLSSKGRYAERDIVQVQITVITMSDESFILVTTSRYWLS